MGLDMYLTGRIYIGGQYEFNKISGVVDIARDGKKIPVEIFNIETITVDIGYWRKANQIHKWFVDNVQDGEDDCNSYYVRREQLADLKVRCNSALANKDSSLLPTKSGFFFGGTQVDDYYWQDLRDTVRIIDNFFKKWGEVEGLSLYYQSSW